MGGGEGGGHGAGRKGVFSILALVTPSQVPLFLFPGSYSLDALCYENNDTDAAGFVSVSCLPHSQLCLSASPLPSSSFLFVAGLAA